MSMSQEEIESLMNGLDLGENESSQEEESTQDAVEVEESASNEEVVGQTVSNDDIDALMNGMSEPDESDDLQVDDILNQIDEKPATNDDIDDLLSSIEESEPSSATVSNDDIDALLNGMDEPVHEEPAVVEEVAPIQEESMDDILASIDEQSAEPSAEEESFDDILASIDGITDTPAVEEPAPLTDSTKSSEDEIGEKIKEGVFPLPAEKDTKVVNQLSQVANDSEEKASKIFDVLSFVLDDNNDVQRSVKNLDNFMEKQAALLESLNTKFPNISVFNEHLEMLKSTKEEVSKINAKIDAENMQIFEAMELMQFHDINRQKIERVMAVIRKLSIYLNNLFEDEGTHKEIAVAKHIHGDNTADLAGDDLESLIAEFGN